MPISTKASIATIVLSLVSFLLAMHFDVIGEQASGFYQEINIGFSIVWTLIIIWIIYSVSKRRDERLILVALGIICSGFLLVESNLSVDNLYVVFSGIEVLLFFLAAFLLNMPASKAWFEPKKS